MMFWHGCSPVNLLHNFRTPFPRNTSMWLFLLIVAKIIRFLDYWKFPFLDRGLMEGVNALILLQRNQVLTTSKIRNPKACAFHSHVAYHRSSPPEVFFEKGVLKIGSKFTGEHPCRSATSTTLLNNFIEITILMGIFL